jgi:rhodanese-related sulfurtransferase
MCLIESRMFHISLLLIIVLMTAMESASAAAASSSSSLEPITLNATTFYSMFMEDTTTTTTNQTKKWFDVIVDVRTKDEYSTGHINGSTLVESLASYNTSNQISTPDAIRGCDYCAIVVYCRSGSRAADAIQHFINAGYKGQFYNGLGVSQWTAAGYPLVVNDISIIPACTINTTISAQCESSYHDNNNQTKEMIPPISSPTTRTTTTPSTPTTTTTSAAPSPSSSSSPRRWILLGWLSSLLSWSGSIWRRLRDLAEGFTF